MKYDGKYVVMSEKLEETPFDTLDAAYMYGAEKFGLENFLLQLFSSRVNQVHTINQTIITA